MGTKRRKKAAVARRQAANLNRNHLLTTAVTRQGLSLTAKLSVDADVAMRYVFCCSTREQRYKYVQVSTVDWFEGCCTLDSDCKKDRKLIEPPLLDLKQIVSQERLVHFRLVRYQV